MKLRHLDFNKRTWKKWLFHHIGFTQKTKKNMDMANNHYGDTRCFYSCITYVACSYYVVC